MALKLPKGKATTTTESKDKGKVIASETVNETVENVKGMAYGTLKPYADVMFEASYTHNLGDFKSARIAVQLRMPCLAEQAEIDETYDFVKGWVDARLSAAVDELTSEE